MLILVCKPCLVSKNKMIAELLWYLKLAVMPTCSGGNSIKVGGRGKTIKKERNGCASMLKLLFLCWNHQRWSNFNTFEIILGQTGSGAINYFWGKCSHTTSSSRKAMWKLGWHAHTTIARLPTDVNANFTLYRVV